MGFKYKKHVKKKQKESIRLQLKLQGINIKCPSCDLWRPEWTIGQNKSCARFPKRLVECPEGYNAESWFVFLPWELKLFDNIVSKELNIKY